MDANQLIEKLGGTFRVAQMAGVKPPSVSDWKSNNRIPDGKLIRLAVIGEGKGACTRMALFPNDWHLIWPELAAAPANTAQAAINNVAQQSA